MYHWDEPLVDQDPNDEPASELMKRIRTAKVRLLSEGKIKKTDLTERLSGDELPYPIPDGWQWERFIEVASIQSNLVDPRDHEDSPHIAPDNIESYTGRLLPYETIRTSGVFSSKHLFNPGCILYSKIRPALAKAVIVHFGGLCSADMYPILPFVNRDYLHKYMLTDVFVRQSVSEDNRVAMPKINQVSLSKILVPVPPSSEQQRIVTKIDELMVLCDRLEESQKKREASRDRLTAASLHKLTNGAEGDELRESARFFISHLSHFTARSEQIQQFREAILEMAVTGRLSDQRPTDGNGRTLLSQLRGGNQRNRSFVFDEATASKPLTPLPESWTWATIDDVAAEDDNAITDGPFGANLKTAHYVETPGYRVVRLQNIGRGQFREEHRSFIDKDRFARLSKHWVFSGDLVVAGLVDPFVRSCVVPDDLGPALVKADCYRFKVHPAFSSRFALYYLNSPMCQRFAAVHHHGMTLVRIGLGNFRLIPIPVPPVDEQHRIVARVDELMLLCDHLENQLTKMRTERGNLFEVVLRAALVAVEAQ